MSDELEKEAADIINQMETKLNQAKDSNKGWGKTINIIFSDIETGYAMKFAMDGSIEKIEKKPASELKIEGDALTNAFGDVEDIKQCVIGYISPMDAYIAGMLKVEGDFKALEKLMPCFPQAGFSL